jgi:protein-disulfide isomerase
MRQSQQKQHPEENNRRKSINFVNLMKKPDKIIYFVIAINTVIAVIVFLTKKEVLSNLQKPILIQESIISSDTLSKGTKVIGTTNAPYTLVEFGDYQCPPCANAHTKVQEILEKNKNVKLVFYHMPLPMHSLAEKAAIIAEASIDQGNFSEVHNKLYFEKALITDEKLNAIKSKYKIQINADKMLVSINNDRTVARKLNVDYTPAFFICTPDNKIYQLKNLDQFNQIVR